jgi:hypothetical protein
MSKIGFPKKVLEKNKFAILNINSQKDLKPFVKNETNYLVFENKLKIMEEQNHQCASLFMK